MLCGKNAKMFFSSGERGEPPKCAAADGMLRASSHIFLGMGEVFWCDNDVLSSLLPLKGTFGNYVRF